MLKDIEVFKELSKFETIGYYLYKSNILGESSYFISNETFKFINLIQKKFDLFKKDKFDILFDLPFVDISKDMTKEILSRLKIPNFSLFHGIIPKNTMIELITFLYSNNNLKLEFLGRQVSYKTKIADKNFFNCNDVIELDWIQSVRRYYWRVLPENVKTNGFLENLKRLWVSDII